MDQQAEKGKTERVAGLGRRTREQIAKWNQMTALRFQTGGRHQTSPASLRGVRKDRRTVFEISCCSIVCRGESNSVLKALEN